MSVFTFGCDPEVFVKDKHQDKFISGWGLVEGTKEAPQLVKNGAVQVDGMALEFNIDPVDSEEGFLNNICSVKEQLQNIIGNALELVPQATVHFDKDVWDNTPEDAKILGCDPDFNALTLQPNPMPDNKVDFRTGGGHIHIGWGQNFNYQSGNFMNLCRKIIFQLDASLGLYSLFKDQDVERNKLYGNPGAFRPKPYGVEYRSLSNFWLKDDEETKKVFRITKKAMEDLSEGRVYTHLGGLPTRTLLWGKNEKFRGRRGICINLRMCEKAFEKDEYGVFNV